MLPSLSRVIPVSESSFTHLPSRWVQYCARYPPLSAIEGAADAFLPEVTNQMLLASSVWHEHSFRFAGQH